MPKYAANYQKYKNGQIFIILTEQWNKVQLRCKSKIMIWTCISYSWVSLHLPNIFFKVRLGAAGQAPCFLFPSLSTSACQLLRMCANSLKRPKNSLCQESLWQTRWQKHGSFNQIPSETFISYEGQKTVERQWNKPICILIICSAPGANWNDWKQHSALLKAVDK